MKKYSKEKEKLLDALLIIAYTMNVLNIKGYND